MVTLKQSYYLNLRHNTYTYMSYLNPDINLIIYIISSRGYVSFFYHFRLTFLVLVNFSPLLKDMEKSPSSKFLI